MQREIGREREIRKRKQREKRESLHVLGDDADENYDEEPPLGDDIDKNHHNGEPPKVGLILLSSFFLASSTRL